MELIGKEKCKKRGRKAKIEGRAYELNKDQSRFFVDLSDDKSKLAEVFNLLEKANKKDLGRDIVFKDLALIGISKLTEKDIEKIQDQSLTEMERVQKSLDEYNLKSGLRLSLGEYLVKKLGIN